MRLIQIATGILTVGLILAIGCGAPAPGDPGSEPVDTEPAPPEPEPEPEPEPDTGGWRVSRSTNPLDDSTTVVAVLNATEGVGGIGFEAISLIARCQSDTTDVYINWHDFLGDDELGNPRSSRKRVTYRFPPADAETEMWGVSTDNDSTFVAGAIPFLRTMVESDRLVAQTTPYNESPSTAIFDLTGVGDALAPLAETCEWTLDPEQARLEREQREQARRAEERRREQERQAERERIMAGLVNTPITSGLGAIARSGSGSLASLTKDDLRIQLQFPAVSTAQLSQARRSGSYRIICSRGQWYDDGGIGLAECSLSE